MMCVVPLCITAIGSVVLFFVADWIYEVLVAHHDQGVKPWPSKPTAFQ